MCRLDKILRLCSLLQSACNDDICCMESKTSLGKQNLILPKLALNPRAYLNQNYYINKNTFIKAIKWQSSTGQMLLPYLNDCRDTDRLKPFVANSVNQI